ncbi:hypothetical protein ISF_07221 [Cordyceps fumosorosea ARSEF 2679]|uniref:Uncharacterized protein n=1 Tax=Cordyceps fumosorosea (strain ARSEF 2679) TaxID=1081104 RepID=A0A167Q525_CORFA|nr:hypothetical protein ISF_07221 [Cordyceps fumosorosea ARSEF 2679]OAA57300.1 hypothetical protein ISF_07221 [Cordyceps fumosorosea ARSEF 2679]
MLDDSLPTFRFQPSSDNPLHTLLYFTHNGSEPAAEYLLKRPPPGQAKNQYALGLVDVHYSSVIYGEVLVRPQWTQPSLSAAELRAQGGVSTVVPIIPDALPVSLYNPDQTVPLRLQRSSFKSDSWEFEMPEQTFKPPSASQIDQDSASAGLAELTPKVLFRWKRDSRLSKDMTCYMTGRSFGGKKSKEPDITIAMYHASSKQSTVTIYEPNMARVEVEDRKGLEVVLLLSAEVIRDLYLMPKQNPFNTSGAPVPVGSTETHAATSPTSSSPPAQAAFASGALPPPPPSSSGRPSPAGGRDAQQQAAIDTETKRLQAMVAEEERKSRDRDRRDQEEQRRIQAMLEREEEERRRRKQAEVDEETERLRRQYGLPAETPSLPPRPGAQGGSGGWFGGASGQAAPPPRPNSTGPPGGSGSSYTMPAQQAQQQHGRAYKLGTALGSLLHGKDDKDHKVNKKRSVHF